jgi:hypothetical protein
VKRLGVVAALALTAAATPTADVAPELAGRFYTQFPDMFMTGEKYVGENVVEIVPVGPRAAYLNLRLDYANGHQCELSGLARQEGHALVLRAGSEGGGPACVLRVYRDGKSLMIDDSKGSGTDGSCQQYCGARGTLSKVTMPFASKRPIRYMPRLKASQDYRAAVEDYNRGRK